MASPLRISALKINDFMRVTAVEMSFDGKGNLIIVSGKNGQGKTSVLNAIAMALGGGNVGKETVLPIRAGQSKADVMIDFGDFTVTKTWETDKKPKLVVMSKDGMAPGNPQTFLNERIGALSFDPFAFARKPAKDQLADLLDVVPLPFDPLTLQAEKDLIFGTRTEVNRRIRDLEGKLAGFVIEDEDDLPDEPVSTAVILEDLAAAQALAQANERTRAQFDQVDQAIAAINERIISLNAQLDEAVTKMTEAMVAKVTLRQRIDELPEIPDIDSFQDTLTNVESINERIRQREAKRRLADDCAADQGTSTKLTTQLEAIDKRKADAMAEAVMPIEGLGFDEAGVTYNGIPFAQASGAERLRISTAMAMALNPTIRVIRITDGSLLDADNMAVLAEMAGDQDFQVIIERVTNESGVGFEMVDGALAE